MQHYKKHLLIGATLLAFLCLSPILWAQSTKTRVSKKALLKEWEKVARFKQMVHKEIPNFSFYAALVYDGKIIADQQMGYANRATKLLLDKNTIFPWGSVSKMFTSIAIHRLIHQGKVKFTDPIIKYIPELGKGVDSLGGMRAIKIHHLLNHNSGISLRPCYDSLRKVYPRFKNSIPSIREMMPFLGQATQRFKSGTKYRYSNGAYSLLGVTVERITGIEFTKYVSRHIFRPLGMKTAHYGVTPKRLSKYFTRAYFSDRNNKIDTMNFDVSQGFQEGNGGVKATAKDMLKFMDFLKFRKRRKYLKRYEKVLPWQVMQQYYFNVDVSKPSNFFVQTYKGREVLAYRVSGFSKANRIKPPTSFTGHSGGIEFHSTFFLFSNEQPMGILLMCNIDTMNPKSNRAKLRRQLFVGLRDFPLFFKFKSKFYTPPKKK